MSGNLEGTLVLIVDGENKAINVTGMGEEDSGRWLVSGHGYSVEITLNGGKFNEYGRRSVTVHDPEAEEGFSVEVDHDSTEIWFVRSPLWEEDEEEEEIDLED